MMRLLATWNKCLFNKEKIIQMHNNRFAKKVAQKEKFGDIFDAKVFQKKFKTPDSLFLINDEGAQIIETELKHYIQPKNTLLEFNPGIGLMTKKFCEWKKFDKLVLVDPSPRTEPLLCNICRQYQQEFIFHQADFVNIWKLAFQDRIDGGSRVTNLLKDVPKSEYGNDTNFIVFGGVGSHTFFKHLINSITFQNSLLSYGRCEFFLIVPPTVYIHLTCSNNVGYMVYRSTSLLFQIIFEHRFLTKIPREYFLPEQRQQHLGKGSKLKKLKSIDPEYLYLVKLVPRQNLFDLIPANDLPAFWYFVKQNLFSRSNRIIPNLEKFIPGCGPRIIVNSTKPETPKKLYPKHASKFLPPYSMPSVEITNTSFFPNIDIYTEFGDMTPSQILTLFCEFRSWPEYKDSSFVHSLENNLFKLEISDHKKDSVLDMQDHVEILADMNQNPTSKENE